VASWRCLLVTVTVAGCGGTIATSPRTATWTFDAPHRAFTLVIEEPGAAPLRIAGDARGALLPAPQRRALLGFLDSAIERLEDAPRAVTEVAEMRRVRGAYAVAPR
jgi:hypothetical protein